MFEAEVNEFKNKTADMDELQLLLLTHDLTKPLSNLNLLSDDEDLYKYLYAALKNPPRWKSEEYNQTCKIHTP